MIELKQDLWSVDADWICITTNAEVDRNGHAIMGRGVALEAKQRFKSVSYDLGCLLLMHGNHVHCLGLKHDLKRARTFTLWSFPTKNQWRNPSSLALIEQSCKELVKMWELEGSSAKVVLPMPGCANGQLNWQDVKPVLERYFDTDHFIIVSKE